MNPHLRIGRFNAGRVRIHRLTRIIASLAAVLCHVPGAQAQPVAPPVLSTVPSPPPGASAQPAQMSGLPLQVGDLPPGIVTVRVIRGSFMENVTGQRVDLRVSRTGEMFSGTTDRNGRAQFEGLKIGDTVQARATLDGETLESQTFQLPSEGGVRLMLVSGVGAGTASGESWAPVAAGFTGNVTGPRRLPATPPSVQLILGVLIGAFAAVAAMVFRSLRRDRGGSMSSASEQSWTGN